MNNNYYIHKTADVQTIGIGEGTRIWQFNVILKNARIGEDVNICSHCFIENDVIVGNRVTIKSGVQLWDGIRIEDDVFIGPNVTFTNDKFPRSKSYPDNFLRTHIKKNASIGAGAIILPGVTIEENAMVGAGALVAKSVPAFGIVKSPAANLTGYVDSKLINTENTNDSQLLQQNINTLKCIQDSRGSLTFGEFLRDIPFSPKRYFIVYDVPVNKVRGGHAHYICHQFLICVRGSCTVMTDDGNVRTEVSLNSANKGIHLPPLTWATQYQHSPDAMLLVFTSNFYEEDDYIHDYSVFHKIVKSHNDI